MVQKILHWFYFINEKWWELWLSPVSLLWHPVLYWFQLVQIGEMYSHYSGNYTIKSIKDQNWSYAPRCKFSKENNNSDNIIKFNTCKHCSGAEVSKWWPVGQRPVHWWLLSIKFYWNIVMLSCFHIIDDCKRDCLAQFKLSSFWYTTEKVC